MKVTMTDGKLIRIWDFALLPDCVIGLVSVFFSENVLPGEYTVELDSGKIITITIYCS